MYFNDDLKPGMKIYIRKTAWTGFIYALASVVLGIFLIATPAGTLAAFVGLLGFFMLIHGVILTITSLIGIKRDPHWFVGSGAGLIQLLLGLFITTRAGAVSNTAMMLSTVGIGLIGIFTGTYKLISAIRYRDIVKNVWPVTMRGALLFVIGVAMLLAPFGFGTAMIRTVGVFALVSGILQLWTSVLFIREKNNDQA